jgi:diguanylate cyclase
MTEKPPSEVARATLHTLAARQLLPTPENFSSIFHEISGRTPIDLTAIALAQAISDTDGDPKTIRLAKAAAASGDFKKAIALLTDSSLKLPTRSSASSDSAHPALLVDLHEQIARLLEFSIPAFGDDDAQIGSEAIALADFCRANASSGSLAPLKSKISRFNHRLSFVAEDQAAIRRSLLSMLRLIFENIAELIY